MTINTGAITAVGMSISICLVIGISIRINTNIDRKTIIGISIEIDYHCINIAAGFSIANNITNRLGIGITSCIAICIRISIARTII